MRNENSCPGFYFNKTDDYPRLKFHQEVGCPVLEDHGYIFWKDVKALATIVDQFNKKSPRTICQPCTTRTGARQASEEMVSETDSARRVQYLYISSTELPTSLPVESIFPLDLPGINLLLLPNQVVLMLLSNGYA